METISVDLGTHSYTISIRAGLMDTVGAKIKNIWGEKKIGIITDDVVDHLYGGRLEKSLLAAGLSCKRIVFKAGEPSKNLSTLAAVYDQLADYGITRSDAIITFGGGVPGDLGGFAAATFLRGIPFIQIPTTILAQVDSSVGGKVAVDLPSGKNLAGSFYQPKAVFIDPDLLQTLPTRIVHDGLAEVIKYGCIRDSRLFDLLEAINTEKLPEHWEEIIKICCTIKARVVEQDERDTGDRMLLNFGHTIGHAIEKQYGYGTYTHGEAVAAGMAMITRQTEKMGITEKGTADRLQRVLETYQLPVAVDAPPDQLVRQICHDKKMRGDRITLIVLDAIGTSHLLPVPAQDVLSYIPEGVQS